MPCSGIASSIREKAVLTVENFRMAVQQVALTSLRNVIGQHDLDEVLKERDKINGY